MVPLVNAERHRGLFRRTIGPYLCPMPQTTTALARQLKQLKLTAAQAAKLMGVAPRTVRRWLDGTRAVPEPVTRLLECWKRHGLPPSR